MTHFCTYLNTSNVTCCFAMASTVFSYMWTLWIPMPQKMANASTKFSSFLVNGKLSNLLTNWNTPKTLFGLLEYMMGMHKMVLCLKSLSLSTSGSNLKNETQIGSYHVLLLRLTFFGGKLLGVWISILDVDCFPSGSYVTSNTSIHGKTAVFGGKAGLWSLQIDFRGLEVEDSWKRTLTAFVN